MRKGEENAELGAAGEEVVVAFLKRIGYRILDRNFRCKGGEIDIVASDRGTIVFIEVKTRRNLLFGEPQLAVTAFKQRQVSKAALTWLAQEKKEKAPARFDVVAVLLRERERTEIDHIRNAFDLAY